MLPNPDSGARSTAPVEIRKPWAGRIGLPGWWRLLAWRRRPALRADLQAALRAAGRLAQMPDEDFDRLLGETRRTLRAAVARTGEGGMLSHRAQAMAVLAEAAHRQLGQRPERGQLMAAMAMVAGQVAEAGPCSGKTLAIALAAAFCAWTGRVCHVIVATDALVMRDAADMTPFYARCGLSAAALPAQAQADAAAFAYRAEVLYATARRVLHDSLREKQGAGPGPARRGAAAGPVAAHDGLQMALVDDADRVMIDDAGMPFIVSEPGSNPVLLEAIELARALCERFVAGRHYRFEQNGHRLVFTAAGQELLDAVAAELPPLWRAQRRRDELLMQAIIVRDRLVRGVHYNVQKDPFGDGMRIAFTDVPVADLLPERTLHVGLTQALEAREGLPLSHPPRTSERISYQAFFGRYQHLGGAAGDLRGLENELWRVYGAVVQRVAAPAATRAAVRHEVVPDAAAGLAVAAESAAVWGAQGHAVLIGLRRVDAFRPLVEALQGRNARLRVLGVAPPRADDWVLAAGEVLVVPEALLLGADLKLERPRTPVALVLPEALDSTRAERSFWARGARLDTERVGLRLIALDQRAVPAWLRRLAADATADAGAPPAAALGLRLLLRRILYRARRRAARGARWQRHQLFLHEQQLRLQLAFAAARGTPPALQGAGRSASSFPGDPHAKH
ncbi:hypothetical protein GCM10023144_23040 [Pigmentiphaga soli]|uniref:SecA family profile domain-containing protein n=2 Tax=Pigmentiphaga soli TaxID=1007095 RepID=A0ABP8H0L4_9BURK